MVVSSYLFLLLFIFENASACDVSSNSTVKDKKNARLSYIHTIEEDLLHSSWEEEEKPCLRQLLRVVRNVQNSTLWATWIWDSMQFPVGQLYGTRIHLGNYDQCLNLPWKDHPELRTQYCLAELDLSGLKPDLTDVDLQGNVQEYFRYKTKHGLTFNNLEWGICAPVACEPKSIAKFADAMFRSTHLAQIENQVDITVKSEYCQVAGEVEKTTFGDNMLIYFLEFLIILSFFCTFSTTLKGHKSWISEFARAFNMKNNAGWLVEIEDQSIRSVLGIRMFSVVIVFTGHLWIVKNVVGVMNAGEIDKKFDHFAQYIVFNVDMVVDTFLMLSGLLLAKGLMERKRKSFNPFAVIAKRYIRFIFSIILIILVQPMVLLGGDTGPLGKKNFQREVDACRNNWWKTILMIGNYGDSENMCYPALWSLMCDFHLFIIGVLIFCIYRRNRTAGIKAYVIAAATSVVLPVLYGYIHKCPAVVSFGFFIGLNPRKYTVGEPMYVRTHLRAGPYFVGLAAGYLMALYNPRKYKNVISKKSSTLAFITFVSMFVLLNILSGIYHGRNYTPLEGALFSVTRRNVFAILVAFLIMICEYGTLPCVSDFLGWSGWVTLSKLSFGVYLNHIMVIMRMISRTRVPKRSDITEDIYSTFGLLVVTMLASFFMYLFWEAPALNLTSMMMKRSNGILEGYVNLENNGIGKSNPLEYNDRKLDEKNN